MGEAASGTPWRIGANDLRGDSLYEADFYAWRETSLAGGRVVALLLRLTATPAT